MKNTFIYPYRVESKSAGALASALGATRIKHDRSKYRGSPYKTVINWGASEIPNREVARSKVLNRPEVVRMVSNKLSFFRLIKKARVVPWTDSLKTAKEWLSEGHTIVVRNLLTSHSGNGIVLVGPERETKELSQAPLYTQYVPKTMEFRVHIVKGEVIDVQRKIRDPDREPTDWKVRSHVNGFIFVRKNFKVPEDVYVQSKLAFQESGLDFGACDIVWNEKQRKAFILEINSAPGIENTSVENYATAFKRIL